MIAGLYNYNTIHNLTSLSFWPYYEDKQRKIVGGIEVMNKYKNEWFRTYHICSNLLSNEWQIDMLSLYFVDLLEKEKKIASNLWEFLHVKWFFQ